MAEMDAAGSVDCWRQVTRRQGEADPRLTRQQWTAMWIFVAAIVVLATLGAVELLRPVVAGKPRSMVLAIQMFMLMAGALIVAFTRTNFHESRATHP